MTAQQEELVLKILGTYKDILEIITKGDWVYHVNGSDILILPKGSIQKVNELIIRKNTLMELL